MNQKLKLIITLFTLNVFSLPVFSQTPCPTEIGLKDVFVVEKGQGYGLCRDYILHQDVTFHFADLIVPNSFLFADFDDGNGLVQVYSQSSINYATAGEKEIEFNINYISNGNGGPGYTAHYRMKLTIVQTYGSYVSPDDVWEVTVDPSITWTPPCSDAYEAGSPFLNSTIDSANAYIKYGVGHTELVRPLIFVDGLDFSTKKIIDPNVGNQPIRNGGTGWDVFIMGSSESFLDPQDYSEFQRYPSQFNDILAASYDIVFLDFKNGSDYIQKNALLLKELILQINALKIADPNTGILHQNVIVGASMGGQIAKYTLAKMEADGISHCSSDYLSFDSPHQGANIPMGLQAAAWYFNGTSSQKSLWENLNSPAVRQLLIQNFGGEVQDGNLEIKNTLSSSNGTDVAPPDPNIDFNCLRIDFVQTMESLGYPTESRNIAISCGSKTAVNQGYNDNAHLFKGNLFITEFGVGTIFNLDLWGNQSQDYYHVVNEAECGLLYASIFTHNIPGSNSIFVAESPSATDDCSKAPINYYATNVKKNNPSPSFDNAPGCFRSDLFSLRKEIKEQLESAGSGIVTSEILNNRVQQCFMPTMSTLDIDWELNDINMNLNIQNSLILDNNLTPFVDFFAPETNLKHVEIDSAMQVWINNQLSEIGTNLRPTLPTIAGDAIYNFGNPFKFHIPAVTVTNGGELRVNYPGNTGYGNESPTIEGLFEARTGGCNNGDLIIDKGGKFILGNDNTTSGEPEHRANVTITTGNRVHIKDGGTLRLARGSQLIIESGGVLEIDADANIDLWWGEYYPLGGYVEGSTIHIKGGGELIINGAFNYSGQGFFQFDQGNNLTLNAPFELTGNGMTDRFIRLNNKATLDVGISEKIILKHGLIEYIAGSKIKVGISGEAEIEHVTFEAQDVDNDNKGIYAEDAAKINILDAEFNNFWTGIELNNMNLSTDIFKLSLVYFNDCEIGIYADLCKFLDVSGAYFTPYDNASTAMELVNVEQVDFVGSANGFANPLGAIQLTNNLTANAHALTEFTDFKVNGADIKNNEIGINVWDDSRVDILVTNGALIDNNTYGIKADGVINPQTAFANVTVNRGSQISNNTKGIYIGKGMNYNQLNSNLKRGYGTVEMTCAKLLDNLTGVEGEDLWSSTSSFE